MKNLEKKNSCVLCRSKKLINLVKLKTPLANSYDKKINHLKKKFPLELVLCNDCKHVQLKHVVNKQLLFSNYLYVSGTSSVFVSHFKILLKTLLRND